MNGIQNYMKKHGITFAELGSVIGCSEERAREKIYTSDISYSEARKIREFLFPCNTLESLFG